MKHIALNSVPVFIKTQTQDKKPSYFSNSAHIHLNLLQIKVTKRNNIVQVYLKKRRKRLQDTK